MYTFRRLLSFRSDRISSRVPLALFAGVALLLFLVWPIPQYSTPVLAFTVLTTLQVKHENFLEDFNVAADYIRNKEPYTFVFELLRRRSDDAGGEGQYVILERFVDKEAWSSHKSSKAYKEFHNRLKVHIDSGAVKVISEQHFWDTALGFGS